ncbi:phytase [Ornithinimicrobium panacihumi]|uniref:phytase n=1 Tax=Ornithinimicrobium panacihumi TaxID=2008449 RepID=UPI003F8BE721
MSPRLRPALSLALVTALAAGPALAAPPHTSPGQQKGEPAGVAEVTTDNETPVLYDSEEGGNASGDDPAIWVDGTDSANSLVIVTAKEGGLRVYDLGSRELQSVAATPAPRADGEDGRYNNVDVAYDVPLGGEPVDVAVVSDRYNDQVRFWVIDPDGARADQPLTEVTAVELPFLFHADREGVDTEQTAYGLAVWQPRQGGTYVVVTQEGTTAITLVKVAEREGRLGYEPVDTIEMPGSFPLPDGTTWVPCEEPGVGPQFEGVAVDRQTGTLFAAQEDVGLWSIKVTPKGFRGKTNLIDTVRDFGIHDAYDEETEECSPVDPEAVGFGGNLLEADAEGVDIYYGRGATGYVVVSSQGESTFAVYQRQGNHEPVGSFRVRGVAGVDDIHGSDGLAIASRPVGDYTRGLLVTHDEPESGPGVDEEQDPTNFSYVDWGQVADALGLRLR